MPSVFTTENTEVTEKNLVWKVSSGGELTLENFIAGLCPEVTRTEKADRMAMVFAKAFSVLSVSCVVNQILAPVIARRRRVEACS